MKIKSMVDFVIDRLEFRSSEYYQYDSDDNNRALNDIEDYALFLKRQLKIDMFLSDDITNVLFKGFNIDNGFIVLPNGNNLHFSKLNEFYVKDLIDKDLELTYNGISQFTNY